MRRIAIGTVALVTVVGGTPLAASSTTAHRTTTRAGCPKSAGSDVGLTKKKIRLGTVADRTGPVAGLYAGAQQGSVAFAQYANSTGGLCGRQVAFRFADSGTNCQQDRNDTKALVKHDFALVGSYASYDGNGCGATIIRAHPEVPDIHVAIDPTAERPSNHFDLQPGHLGYATGMFAYYRQRYGVKVERTGTIAEDIPVAMARQRAIVGAAKTKGFRFVYNNAAAPTTSNFASNFKEMCGKDHIQVFFSATESVQNDAAMIAAEHAEPTCHHVVNILPSGYDPQLVTDYQGAPSDLNGIQGWNESALYFTKSDAATIPEVARLQQWFRRTNPGQQLSLSAMYAWADGRLFQTAFEAAKIATRAGVLKALHQVKQWRDDGLISPITPSSKKMGAHCYVLWQIKHGRFERTHDVASTRQNPGGYRCDGSFRKA